MASKLIIDRIPPDMHVDEEGNIVWTPRLIDFNAAAYTRGHVVTADEFNTELIKQTYQGNYNTDTISVLIGLYNDLKIDVSNKANTANTNAATALSRVNIAEANSIEALGTANTALSISEDALADVQAAISASTEAVTIAENTINIAETAKALSEDASDKANAAVLDAEEAMRIAEGADAVAIGAEDIANEAKQIAETANNTSNTANANASNAVNTANAASQTANEAKSTASTAAYSAGNAVTTANTANTNASTALDTANTANTTSATALTKASEAVTTANTAVTTANAAKEESANASNVANTASAKIEQAVLDINEAKAVAEEAAASVADKASTGYVTEVLKDYYTSGEVDSKLSTVKVDLSDYYTKQEINNTLHAHYIPNKGWSALEGGLSIYNAEEKDVFSVGSDTDECYINIWSSSGDAYIGLNADGKLSYKYISVATPQEFVFKNALEQQYQKLPKWNTSNQADHAGQFCYIPSAGDLYIASGGQWNLVGGNSKANKTDITVSSVNGKTGAVNLTARDTGALSDYTLTIHHQSAGNPRMVKFVSVNYATSATCFKMSAMTCHDNGISYQFLTDILIAVTTSGQVTCNIYKFAQQEIGSVDGVTRYTGDVFYVNDTVNKRVEFFILCGQWSSSQFTPVTKVGSTVITNVGQHSGNAEYYSGGVKSWADGCGSTYALGMLTGTNPPTSSTKGAIGQFYHATDYDDNYVCVGTFSDGTYNWKYVGGASSPNKQAIVDLIYPVYSFFFTTIRPDNFDPADKLGGKWELIEGGRALWTAQSNGLANSYLSAGLPNITGGFMAYCYGDGGGSGAFASGTSNGNTLRNGSTGGYNFDWYDFNANRSSEIYGASTTVQPPAYTIFVWHRIG
jgi:hypothetical protein